MTADQLLRSLATLTNVTLTPSNETAVMAEYNSRFSSMPSDYNPSNISAPSVISVASIAGEFCDAGITQDMGASSSSRKLLPSSLNLAATSISESEFIQSGQLFANRFWGRSFSANEETAVRDFYAEMKNATDAGAKTSAKDMIRALCGALLASFDSISI